MKPIMPFTRNNDFKLLTCLLLLVPPVASNLKVGIVVIIVSVGRDGDDVNAPTSLVNSFQFTDINTKMMEDGIGPLQHQW